MTHRELDRIAIDVAMLTAPHRIPKMDLRLAVNPKWQRLLSTEQRLAAQTWDKAKTEI